MDAPLRSFPPDSTPQQASHNLRHMVDEIDTFLRSAADTGDQKFDAARERLSLQVRQMRQQLDELNEAASVRVKRAAQQADQTVHAHPYTAMGMAAAVGLLVGYLATRR
jgi:ElaB/YqjD/DUF883 family membrane-anchored ribosome-binding protein